MHSKKCYYTTTKHATHSVSSLTHLTHATNDNTATEEEDAHEDETNVLVL